MHRLALVFVLASPAACTPGPCADPVPIVDRSGSSAREPVADALADFRAATGRRLCLGGVIVEEYAPTQRRDGGAARFAAQDRTVRLDRALLPRGRVQDPMARTALWEALCVAADTPGRPWSSDPLFADADDPRDAYVALCAERAPFDPLTAQLATLCEDTPRARWSQRFYGGDQRPVLGGRTVGDTFLLHPGQPPSAVAVANGTAYVALLPTDTDPAAIAAFDLDGTLRWRRRLWRPIAALDAGYDKALAIDEAGGVLELRPDGAHRGPPVEAGVFDQAAQVDDGWLLGGWYQTLHHYDLVDGATEIDHLRPMLQNVGREVWAMEYGPGGYRTAPWPGGAGPPYPDEAVSRPVVWQGRVTVAVQASGRAQLDVPLDGAEPVLVAPCEAAPTWVTDAGEHLYALTLGDADVILTEVLP